MGAVKKLMLWVVLVAMVTLGTGVAQGESGEVTTFYVEQVPSAAVGEMVQVSIVIQNPLPPISSLEMEFSYDTRYLQWMRNPETDAYFEFGKAARGFLTIGNPETNQIALVSLDSVLKEGVLVTLNFQVTEPIPQDHLVVVSASKISAFDDAQTQYPIVCTQGGVLGVELQENPSETTTPTNLPVAYGDVGGDGKINAEDALLILKYLVDKGGLTPLQKLAAEVDGDLKLTAKDALNILRYAVDKIQKFPIEK